MSATTIMMLAFGLLVVTHWANNKPAVSVKVVIEMAFAILFIALLDQGKTEPIATGFAWLFLVAVLLRGDSILTALSKAENAKTTKKASLCLSSQRSRWGSGSASGCSLPSW